MARITFFHTPEPRAYDYKPRYYSESKEQLESVYRKYGKNPEDMKKPVSEFAESGSAQEEAAQQVTPSPKPTPGYVPGSLVRGAFTQAKEKAAPGERSRSKMKKMMTMVTVAIGFVMAYFLAEGFIRLIR